MRAIRVLLGSLLGFLAIEILVFDTGIYSPILSPASSTGLLELYLRNEMQRTVKDRNQVLAVGDSRMGFFARYPNALKTGYTFATISTAGTTPRCWYYMLREVDPTARRYSAILIPVEDYEDAETWEDHADRLTDLHYLIPQLRWSDLSEFSGSYHSRELQWKVRMEILFKGLVYKDDFQDFLRDPGARIKYADLARRDSHDWYYDYVGTADTVDGVSIDWKNRTVSFPPNFTSAQKDSFHRRYLDVQPSRTGRRTAYLTRWFRRICDRYRGSGTRIIFFRLPRGPFPRPEQPAFNPHSSVRELTSLPEVILDQEHFFDSLENPALFWDAGHMNAPGCAEFSRMLGLRVRQLLGPAAQAQ